MHFLPENSRRRENVIAGLTSVLVGVAMLAIAGKASAIPPSGTHDRTTIQAATMAKEPEDESTAYPDQDHVPGRTAGCRQSDLVPKMSCAGPVPEGSRGLSLLP